MSSLMNLEGKLGLCGNLRSFGNIISSWISIVQIDLILSMSFMGLYKVYTNTLLISILNKIDKKIRISKLGFLATDWCLISGGFTELKKNQK